LRASLIYVLTSGVKSYTPLINTKPLTRQHILSSNWSSHPENRSMVTRCAPAECPQNHTDLSKTDKTRNRTYLFFLASLKIVAISVY
jgi:hypothetical protein